MQLENYNRNIFIIYLYYIAGALSIGWLVIEILLYQAYNLNFFQISVLAAVAAAIVLILEVPSGAFADLYGKKNSLLVAGIMLILGTLIYIFSSSFYHFLLGIFVFSAAQAFFSGAEHAIIYESLKKLKRSKEFENIIANLEVYAIGVGIATNFYSSLLFEQNTKLPLLIGLFFSITMFILVLFLYEEKKKKNSKNLLKKYYLQIHNSIKYILNKKQIIWNILFYSIWSTGLGVFAYMLNQPIVKMNYSFLEYGIIFSTATIVQTIILYFYKKIIPKLRDKKFLILILIWCIGLPLLLFIENIILFVILMGILWSVGSFTFIFVESNINKQIKSEQKRATVLSINSMFRNLIFLILTPIFGLVLEIITLEQTIYFLTIYSLITGIILLNIKKYFK